MPEAAPIVAVLATLLVAVGRFDVQVAWLAALVGLAMAAAYAVAPVRLVLWFSLLPAAAWIAMQPPWGPMASAVILAGWVALLAGPMPRMAWAPGLWMPVATGISAAALCGVLAGQAGIDGLGPAAALVLVLAAFRWAAVHAMEAGPAYGVLVALSAAPGLGVMGLLVGAVEAVAAAAASAVAPRFRMGLVLGAPAALVAAL